MLPSFPSFQKPLPDLAGHDRSLLFDALPVAAQETMWARLKEQRDDSRFADGLVEFRSRKPRKVRRPAPRPEHTDDRLVEIDAAVYLEAFGSDVFDGGRARCVHRAHEDRNPSVSYRGGEWFCFTCSSGGGIYQAASAASGIGTRGPDFLELRRWIADRLVGMVVA